MKNLQEITERLSAKNKSFEIQKSELFEDRVMIGVRLGKTQWDWYDVYVIDGLTSLFFNHTYSCNTGKVIKSLSHRMNRKSALANVLGVDYSEI